MIFRKGQSTKQGHKSSELHARIIRADGTVVDLGCVSYWHRNPLRRLQWRASKQCERLARLFERLAKRINPVQENTP